MLNEIQLGQKLLARIEEVVSQNNFIVNFDGDLIRVTNNSNQVIRAGDMVEVIVTSVKPLSFKLSIESRKIGLNISV